MEEYVLTRKSNASGSSAKICVMFAMSLLLLSGCGGDGGSESTDPPPTIPIEKTYTQSIEPIFYRSCVACHVDGGIAPFSLKREENGYANAVFNKSLIKQALNSKSMPPFLATNDGSCQNFEHEFKVSDEEINTISRWVDAVTPETVSDLTKSPPTANTSTTIDFPDLVVNMPDIYSVDANISDDYRCFVIDTGLTSDMLLTGYEVVPGNARIVHHVVLFNLLEPNLVSDLEAKDANSPGLGYTCFGDADFQSTSFVAGWAPGMGATLYPQNTGIRLTKNSRLIMQVHYNTDNATGDYDDQSQIKLRLAAMDSPNFDEAYIYPQYVNDFQLTTDNNTVSQTVKLSDIYPLGTPKLNLLGMFPHMHSYGRQISVSRQSAAGDECLVDVGNWDFEWQRYYFFDSQQSQVIIDPQTDSVSINCLYDIPATDAQGNPLTIVENNGSSDEMCLNYYYITPVL